MGLTHIASRAVLSRVAVLLLLAFAPAVTPVVAQSVVARPVVAPLVVAPPVVAPPVVAPPVVAPPVVAPPVAEGAEHTRVLTFAPGVTVTLVSPVHLDLSQPVELILYALPNGNSTAETMGRVARDSAEWRYDIQHIAAQTRALRDRGIPQLVIAYLEADGKSWPAWRAALGYPAANARIGEIVNDVRAAVGAQGEVRVTLTGHSGGGSFAFGFIDGNPMLPDWLTRVAFLDSNYNFEPRHGDKLLAWLRQDRQRQLVSIAYDDREITVNGKKVVSDSGGTWRATERMARYFAAAGAMTHDTLGAFRRDQVPQITLLRHPNPANRILHTELVGEMNGFMHAMLTGRSGYGDANSVLVPKRAYVRYVATPPL
jgi:hypothetical protein